MSTNLHCTYITIFVANDYLLPRVADPDPAFLQQKFGSGFCGLNRRLTAKLCKIVYNVFVSCYNVKLLVCDGRLLSTKF
jgi:hypothetical protein